jgi:hypothetical protein
MNELNPSTANKIIGMEKNLEMSIKPIVTNKVKGSVKKANSVSLRISIIAFVLGLDEKQFNSEDDLIVAIQDKINDSESLNLLVVATLVAIDTIVFSILKRTKQYVPTSLAKPLIKLLTLIVTSTKLIPENVATNIILESFYIASVSSNYANLDEKLYRFKQLSPQEKYKYVNYVITDSFLLGVTYEASTVTAYKIGEGIGSLYERFRMYYLIFNSIVTLRSQRHFDIKVMRVINVITERIKMSILRISKRSPKLRFILRGLLDLVIGPLIIAIYNYATAEMANRINDKMDDEFGGLI